MKNINKIGLLLVVATLVLVGDFSALVPKTNAAATIAVSSALITGPNKITIVFIPVNVVMLTAPITAFGAGALVLTAGGARSITNLDSLTVNTAVYTFDGAPAAGNETALLTVTTPTLITDTASANTFNATLSPLTIGDGQGQVPTVSSIVTGDINGAGTIDRLVLTFSEDISGTTNGTGFAVAGSSCTLGSASETTPGVMTFVLTGCTAGTAVLPTLTYTPGNLVDAATGLNSVGAFGPTSATDSAVPILDAEYVLVDNSVQPNKVTLTFSEPLGAVQAAIVENYLVTNRDVGITYTIASAVLSPSNTVTLTLATVNPADNKTFITNYDIINNPITVTPSASITDAATPANSYIGGLVNDFGEGNLDDTKATVNATLVRTNATTYKVTFSEKVDLTTAQTLNKYTLGGTCLASTGNPSAAVLQANGVDVLLTIPDTSGCTSGQTVIVTPAGTITDVAGVTITSSTATNFVISVPTISTITPSSGTDLGGTSITITGTQFASGATIKIDGVSATNINVISNTSITASTSAGTVGTKDVIVTNTDTGTVTKTGGYTYVPSTLTTITLSPLTASLTIGSATTTQQLTATKLDQYGDPIVATLTWSSSNTAVATVNSSGLVTPVGIGSANITASTTEVTSTAPAVVTVSLLSSDATLSNLSISSGTLSPVFSSDTNSYTDSVSYSVSSVSVTPTRNESHATIKVNNSTVISGSSSAPISLTVGSNTITIVVTAEDSSTSTSTIIVTRANAPSSGSVARSVVIATNTSSSISNCQFVDLLISIGAISSDKETLARKVVCQTTAIITVTPTYNFPRNLKWGMTGDDVKELQKFLNTHGFILTSSGPGSPGNEIITYGPLTKNALIIFQEANFDAILKPLKLTKGTGLFYDSTRNFINNLLKK